MSLAGRIGAAAGAAIMVLILVLTAQPRRSIPLINLQQGVTPIQLGEERVFIVRQGSIVTPIRGRSTDSGEPVVWCPYEQAFVAPTDRSLWNMSGEWVAGPARRDLDTFAFETTVDLEIVIDPERVERARGRSKGTISGEAGQRYQRFAGGDDFAYFCQDPVPGTPAPAGA